MLICSEFFSILITDLTLPHSTDHLIITIVSFNKNSTLIKINYIDLTGPLYLFIFSWNIETPGVSQYYSLFCRKLSAQLVTVYWFRVFWVVRPNLTN